MAAVSKKRTLAELPSTIASVTPFPKIGAFAANCFSAHAVGLYVIPTARDDSKHPLIPNPFRASRQRRSTLEKWATRPFFAGANYGIVCWSSNIIVADCDSPEARDFLIRVFGHPVVIVRSGRAGGGWHLYYRAPRGVTVKGMCLKRFGIDAQIKAGKGFVVGPGSLHPDTGVAYAFEVGGWDDFASLTEFPVDRLHEITGRTEEPKQSNSSAPAVPRPVGVRDNELYKDLINPCFYREFRTEPEIIERARHWNVTRNAVPLEDREVVATAQSVWKTYQAGDLRPIGRRSPALPAAHWDRLRTLGKNYGNALVLYMELKSAHPKGGEFPISAEAMAKCERVPGRRRKQWYLDVTKDLLRAGVIERISWAKHFEGKAALYRFTSEGTP
jgi:hypothetical protein